VATRSVGLSTHSRGGANTGSAKSRRVPWCQRDRVAVAVLVAGQETATRSASSPTNAARGTHGPDGNAIAIPAAIVVRCERSARATTRSPLAPSAGEPAVNSTTSPSALAEVASVPIADASDARRAPLRAVQITSGLTPKPGRVRSGLGHTNATRPTWYTNAVLPAGTSAISSGAWAWWPRAAANTCWPAW
jgi:hypothetical protein